jgi:hypothetical protein
MSRDAPVEFVAKAAIFRLQSVYFRIDELFFALKMALSHCPSITSWLSPLNSFIFIYLLAFNKRGPLFSTT